MIKVMTRGFDKLVLDDQRIKPAAILAGKRAAQMIRDRVSKEGKDAHGKRLPKVEPDKGWFYTSPKDHRFDRLRGDMIFSIRKGAQIRMVYGPGYEALKKKIGGKTHVGAPLTGDMWKSLKVSFKAGPGDGLTVRVYFSGKSAVGTEDRDKNSKKKPKKIKLSNEVKARTLQFRKRGKGSRSSRIFTIMELSDSEKGIIQGIIKSALKFRG